MRNELTGCYAVIFTSKILQNNIVYQVMQTKMIELASKQPGFIGVDSVISHESILISYWQDLESIRLWKEHEYHQKIQDISQRYWYESYQIHVVKVERSYAYINSNTDMIQNRFPKIRTTNGILQVLEEKHAPLLHQYVNTNKDFFAPWEPDRHPSYYELEQCALRISEMRKELIMDKSITLCLLNTDETKMLAYSAYSEISRGVFQSCHLGYSLSEDEQGKGLMHEALSTGIEYIFTEANIHRIVASYMPSNVKSAAVLAKLKFEKEGVAKHYLKIAGQWEDHVMTALVLR